MIHHVFANRSNIGDWLSAMGLQKLLVGPKFSEYLCDEPFVDHTLERLSQASPRDLIVIGGGGLFMDYFTPFWEGFKTFAKRSKYCIWGVGYCDHKERRTMPSKSLIEEIVEASSLCILRDRLSRDYLANVDLPPPVPCPSICAVDSVCEHSGFGILHVDNYNSVGPEAYEAMDAIIRDFADKTQRPFRKTNNRIEPGRQDQLSKCLNLYIQSDIIVSSALHGCIIAVSMGRRVLAVAGDRKIDAFMEAAGLGQWVLNPTEISLLPKKLSEIDKQPIPNQFVISARQRNSTIADQMLSIYAN